jgi:hypothetical protein
MTFPNAHLYLTCHWTIAGAPNEQGQTGIRFDSTAPASQDLVNAAVGPVSTFWTTVTALIPHEYRLTFLRLASIAPNGLYVPGTIAYDNVISGTLPGGGSGGTDLFRYPLQTAMVSSLLTALPRGQAHRGRCYLPPSAGALQSGWLWQPSDGASRTNTWSACLSALNDVMPGPASIFSKGTKAAPTVGAKQVITGVQTGIRPDVQRRRANEMAESPGVIGTVTP